jgi:2-oxoglutarate dehydrogenase E1 component
MDDVAIVRVEQLYPFPQKELAAAFAAYPEAKRIAWVQEEPWNMGAWQFLYHRLRRVVPEDRALTYVGRAEAASPATGSYKVHQTEQADLVNRAFAR